MKILSVAQMRALERAAEQEGATMIELMKMAGASAAQLMMDRMGVKADDTVAVLCGKGRNGGDGFISAAYLRQRGGNSSIILMDGEPRSADARAALKAAGEIGVTTWRYWESQRLADQKIRQSKFIIDALYGIGFKDGFLDHMAAFIEKINEEKAGRIMSIDLPSGVQGDTGRVINGAVKASLTVSFTTLKPAHVLFPAMDYCGETAVADIGIPPMLMAESPYLYETPEKEDVRRVLPKLSVSENKGGRGQLLTICGSSGMAGACAMSAKAALRCGVGLLKIAAADSIYPIVSAQLNEPVFLPVRQAAGGTIDRVCIPYLLSQAEKASSILIGCGLGGGEDIRLLVESFLRESKAPMVIDADGINAVAQHIDILKEANAPVILTPHPGEAARLLGAQVRDIQNNRIEFAQKLASGYGVVAVLKGAKTVIAHPGGKTFVNTSGNAGMARGGSGDVLAGMIASFLAQGAQAFDAAVAGVYLHGLAGDRCAQALGKISMLPTDLISELPALIKEFSNE